MRTSLNAPQELTEDRFILESQILVARESVEPDAPITESDEAFLNWVKEYIANARLSPGNERFAEDDATYRKVRSDLFKNYMQAYRSIEPGSQEVYVFRGLGAAKRLGVPLTLRYKIQSGTNLPSELFRISFMFGDEPQPVQEVGLDVFHTLHLVPNVIDENGRVELLVANADMELGRINPRTITFPPNGLELSYAVGSYRMNYLRVMAVLWIKLAFLAMLAVTAATFLSFPVACLVAFATFMAAEGAGFLDQSLEIYTTVTDSGKIQPVKVLILAIGRVVAWMFRVYSELKPTERLVEGRLLPWSAVAWGTTVLAVCSLVLYGLGVAIFRKRELATYSGQ